MIIIRFLFVILIFISSHAGARPLIADLSLRSIEIDSSFKGTEILLFGARNDAGDVVVVVRGPESSYIVRKKERVAGIWANSKQAVLHNVNGYYVVASSRPLDELRNDSLLDSLGIGINNLKIDIEAKEGVDGPEFKQAFFDKKEKTNLYFPKIGNVSFIGDTLFRTIIRFPDNIPRGVYNAEVYLLSDGQVSGIQSTPLFVKKMGFDAMVFDFAYDYPASYGIMAVLLALIAGWGAGAIFRRV